MSSDESPRSGLEEARGLFSRLLWRRVIEIAQPWWYTAGADHTARFLVLLGAVIVLVYSAVVGVAAGLAGGLFALFPSFFTRIEPQLTRDVSAALQSRFVPLLGLALGGAALIAWRERRIVRAHWMAWGFAAATLSFGALQRVLVFFTFYASAAYTNFLVERDQGAIWPAYALAVLCMIPDWFVGPLQIWLSKRLFLQWRVWSTEDMLARYLGERAFYDIARDGAIDNPDQRISQDVPEFVEQCWTLFVWVPLHGITTLLTYSYVLWAVGGSVIVGVLIYVVVGSVGIILYARPLVGVRYQQQAREADFRYGLVHLRDHAEAIAFYGGQERESVAVRGRFDAVVSNYRELIRWERNSQILNNVYSELPNQLPYLILIPIFLAGQVDFGTMRQSAKAMYQLVTALNLIPTNYIYFAWLSATVHRLAELQEAARPREAAVDGAAIEVATAEEIAFEDVTVETPERQRILVEHLSLTVRPGGSLLVTGPSGAGKTSLLRVLAGLWTTGRGCVTRPAPAETLFLPQKPYMLLGSLRSQLLYPRDTAASEATLRDALATMGLADLPERVGGFDVERRWDLELSSGEAQRLAFARLLVNPLPFVLLDEATSALDEDNEINLYERLRASGATFVSVGHRPNLRRYHQMVLTLDGQGGWALGPCDGRQERVE